MAKSIRSKIKKRLRTVKRHRVDAMIVRPQTQELHDKLVQKIAGKSLTSKLPLNAFKHPEADGACFPQHVMMKPIDFRSAAMPMSGFAFRNGRRKYDEEQAAEMETLKLDSHPEMEVLAGGGAILAKTGQRVSTPEAELLATKTVRPGAASIAFGPGSSASAVVAAVRADNARMVDVADKVDRVAEKAAEAKKDDADHSRRPVLKDTRRAKRAENHRPRANSTKKKTSKPIAVESRSSGSSKKVKKKGKAKVDSQGDVQMK